MIIVYLGGAMGVQAWLMKGFLDTIPKELDESARVDGATPAQIFWGVILPLAAPVLVVVALISFVFTLNEFVIASALLQTNKHFTLPVGLYGFISQNYGQHWGPFAAGSLMALIPVTALFLSCSGTSSAASPPARSRDEPAGVERRHAARRAAPRRLRAVLAAAARRARRRGGRARCACRARTASTASLCRYERDGEPRGVEAAVDEETETDVWWRAAFPCGTRSRATGCCSPAATSGTRG